MRRRSSFPCLFVLSVSALLVLAALPLSAAKTNPPLHPLNLNTTTASELQQVPGIGPSSTAKVLKMREPTASSSVHDPRAIKGIGPKRMEKMRKYLALGKVPAPKHPHNAPANNARAAPPCVRPVITFGSTTIGG
jgi:hypothetical protein